MNKVLLVGRVGQDPEIRFSPAGTVFARLSKAKEYLLVEDEPDLLEIILDHPLNPSLERLSETDPETFKIVQATKEIGERIKEQERGEN